MIKRALSALALVLAGGAAQAGTLDFTDAAFASTFPGFGAGNSTASVMVDGALFTVEATDARGTNGFRQNANGLSFGLPGNGMNIITITADKDVLFSSLFGVDTTNLTRSTPMRFDATAGGVSVFEDLAIPASAGTVDFADFTLKQGDAFIFSAD